MDFHVREQTEERAAPVGPAPGMSEIESTVARLGQSLRQIAHEVGPNLSRLQIAGLHPGDRFDVRRQSLLDPVMLIRHTRKR